MPPSVGEGVGEKYAPRLTLAAVHLQPTVQYVIHTYKDRISRFKKTFLFWVQTNKPLT